MEKLNNCLFQSMDEKEMNKIYGGGIWSTWKDQGHCCGTKTLQQRFNWFGLHGTDDTRIVEDS
jgi:bacteriocin-like protein